MTPQQLEQLNKAQAGLLIAFEEHKKAADARFAAIEAGKPTAALDEKLAKIAVDLDASEKSKVALLKTISDLEKKVEARENRGRLGAGGSVDQTEDDDPYGELKKNLPGERKAFMRYLRKGVDLMNDDERKVLVERKSLVEQKVLSIADGTTGGFLAPPQFATEIIKAAVLFTPARDYVTVQRIGTGEYIQPKRTGTAAATRVGEVQTRVESQNPAWGQMKIPAPEMYAEARVSFANLEDSAFDLEALLRAEFAEQFGVKEGAEFVTGIGTNQLLGITDANAAGPGTALATTGTGTATIAGASGVQGDPIIALCHAVKSPYAANGTWALNRASLGKVRLLKDTQGRYLWDPGALLAKAPPTILGYPYFEAPDMPDEASNALPIAFGDFRRGYMIVERIDIMITRDPYTLASVGQLKLTARRRVGGQVVLGEALRLLKCA